MAYFVIKKHALCCISLPLSFAALSHMLGAKLF
jgi:hypothetical protein